MTAEPTQPAAAVQPEPVAQVIRIEVPGLTEGQKCVVIRAINDWVPKEGTKLFLAPAAAVHVPVAWIRVHPDGTYSDDLLPNWQIERVRRESGAWIPLSLAASAPPPPEGAPVAQPQAGKAALEFDDELSVFTWGGRSTLDTLEVSQDVLAELDRARGWQKLAETAQFIHRSNAELSDIEAKLAAGAPVAQALREPDPVRKLLQLADKYAQRYRADPQPDANEADDWGRDALEMALRSALSHQPTAGDAK